MRNKSQRLVPLLLLLLQATLPATCSQLQEEKSTISREGNPQPSIPAQPSAHHQQRLFDDRQDPGYELEDGTELVDKALILLRRYEAQHPRFSTRRPAGVLGYALRYISYLLPSLNFQGPPEDADKEDNYAKRDLPPSVQEGVRLLETAAGLNNPDALYLLAEANFYGNFSVPVDYTEAFRRYYQLASLNGNSSAQHMVGFMYATGIGNAVERDQAKALLYYTFAARGGNERSEMAVAFRHHSGIGTTRNCEESMKYYKSVADKAIDWYRSGPPGGMAWVPDSYRIADEDGGVYGEGASFSSAGSNANKGGPSSDAYAALDDVLEYLDLMSRKGDFKATFSLGRIHYDGQKGLPRNLNAARRYFMTVARQYWQKEGRIIDSDKPGLEKIATKAAGYLGRMFMRGEGVELSYEKASIWYNRGVKGGDAGSQYGLGLLYLHGLGVPKNTIKATEYFKAAADQDYPSAQVQLGALYLDQGTAADIGVANRYFELAARYNHIEALYFLAELINYGVGRDRSCGLANAYYKTVAEKAEPLLSAFGEANEAYENDDYELALADYMLAAEQGWEKAQVNVAYLLDLQKSYLVLPSWLKFKSPRPSILQNAALALIYWTRSAKQANIDSMVKMGDYYLNGIGTEPDMEKAAACYTGASEFHQSAQALYNLGWMHENGVGLDQDFHLAKRFYDQALETNEEAYLPVTLSLIKLRIRSAWNTITHGRINSIQDEPEPKRHWSFSEWMTNFLQDDYQYYGDADYDEGYLPDSDPLPGGDADGLYEDIIDDGLLESFIIIGLAAALVFLVYYRQQRQAMHRREEARAQGAQGMNDQQALGDRGFFPQPGDPEFNQWVVGGIGH
ncbi:ubiquitin-protein ligase-like protein Sel1/Ubx2 [Xylogone sp. PMI_703]|nr:ubiquitin-protein ligase-like protein Sel1/Ubx2 [Xylogone sp. PMI_703]